MFRDRILNWAFLISLFWHLFWMSVVTIVTVPTGLRLADYTRVSFLGPILERTAYDLMLGESSIKAESMYMHPLMPQYTFDIEIDERRQMSPEPVLKHDSSQVFNFSLREVMKEDKLTPPYFFNNRPIVSEEGATKSPIEGRKVVFKPDGIPKAPKWIAGKGERFRIELEFTVSPGGIVENVTPLVSSGYPKIDVIGMDYLKKWRFSPLEEKKDQSGRVEIELRAE